MFVAISAAADIQVIHYHAKDADLEKFWQMGQQKGDSLAENYWIGYSILLKSEKNHRIRFNRYSHDYPTLGQIIYNKAADTEALKPKVAAIDFIENELGILYQFGNNDNVREIVITSLDGSIDLENMPVIWLGVCRNQNESLQLQTDYFKSLTQTELKENALVSIALHQVQPEVKDFLIRVIESEKSHDLIESGLFWLAQQDAPGTASYLKTYINQTDDAELAEKAVFSLSQIKTDAALDYLIDVAKNSSHMEIRKEAIFWLGQKASERSAAMLQSIIYSEDEQELKEQAVFALAQLPDNDGVPELIQIATGHENIEVRKKAIFWLGQTEDPRALQTIIAIIESK
jgi:hypothetical protein